MVTSLILLLLLHLLAGIFNWNLDVDPDAQIPLERQGKCLIPFLWLQIFRIVSWHQE